MKKNLLGKTVKGNRSMAPPAIASEKDSFEVLCITVWRGLTHAVRELGWIADGISDASTTFSDRSLANLKRLEFAEKLSDIQKQYMSYGAKAHSVKPPSDEQLAQASRIATELASWTAVNVSVRAVLNSSTELLKIYGESTTPDGQA